MLDGQYNTYINMNTSSLNSNGYYEFTPTVSGTYHLRLDVNKEGETHQFWNISITEKSKQVVYGQSYGTLPTPTREGYKFMGWNGKNKLINFYGSKNMNGITWTPNSNGSFNAIGTSTGRSYRENVTRSKKYMFKPGTYTFSFNKTGIACNDIGYLVGAYYIGNDTYAQNIAWGSQMTFTITQEQFDTLYLEGYYNIQNSGTTVDCNLIVQVEEGSTATAYEPYYIKSDTTVVQDKNHTLKAIWEANS